MKKNSFKRFLAVTLAAATALTFAPVSTLGLTGVVQAQAAALSGTSATLAALTVAGSVKNTNYDTWASDADATATGTATLGSGNEYFGVKITAGSNNTKYTITTTGSSVSRFGDAESADVKGKTSFELAGSASDSVVFKAAAKGKTTVTIVAHDTTAADATGDKTLTLNFVVHGSVSSAKFEDSSINVTGNVSATKDATIDFTGALKGDTYYLVSGNSAVFTVADKQDGNTTSAAVSLNKLSADEKDEITLTKVANGDTYLYVYADKAAADADTTHTKALAKVPVSVADPSLTVTPSFTKVDDYGTIAFTKASSADTLTLKFLNGTTNVTDQFKLYADNNGLSVANPVPSSQASPIYVKAPAAGTYTVEVTEKNGATTVATKTATFTVSANGSSVDPSTTTTQSSSAYYGGVITDPIVTDGTNYSLVDSSAKILYDGNVYQAGELTWYLTKDNGSANPNNVVIGDAKAGSIDAGAGKLNISVIKASNFASATSSTYVVGIAKTGASNKVVYSKAFSPLDGSAYTGGTKQYTASVDASLADASTANKELKKDDGFLGVQLMGANNDYLNDKTTSILAGIKQTAEHFTVATSNSNNLKKSTLTVTSAVSVKGTYVETIFVPYTDTKNNVQFVAQIKLTVSVGEGPQITVRDGATVYGSTAGVTVASDPTIYLDLKTNKTFDVTKYISSNIDGTTYSWSSSSANVDVKDGVITAKSAGYAEVYIDPVAGGVKGSRLTLYVRVNENGFDTLTVAGSDKSEATVLNYKQYTNNVGKLTDKERLAKAQVKYIKIDVTGKETSDIKEPLTVTSANKATVTYSLEDAKAAKLGVTVNGTTGEISIPHSYTTSDNFAPFSFAVKAVSAGTTTSANTTNYFYVVVDYKDITVSGLEDTYEVGTYTRYPDLAAALYFKDTKVITTTGSVTTSILGKDDDLVDSNDYEDDDATVFGFSNDMTRGATAEGKTMHVLVKVTGNKQGTFYKVVTIKSVPGKKNYVTKIVNVADGKTIYEADGATSGAAITIDKKTVVKVTVAYAPDASLNAKDDPAFTINGGSDLFNHNTENVFVAATENPKTYEVTLIPSMEGTQVIYINPTEGRLSKSDYSLVDTDYLAFSVKYDASAATTKPAKITGLKVSNKKGAKVTVKFNKVTTNSTMRYYVQKKVGSKVSGKSVGSTKTTLSVKKGATVKVRVKAYYYDENGKKHVGKYSAWKTLKTDKK